MTTLIEKDSPTPAILVIAVIFLLFLGGGFGLAYMGGVFTGKSDVIANDRRIADEEAKLSAADAKRKNMMSQTTEASSSQGTPIHPVLQDNGVGNGDKDAKNSQNQPQQEDYHQQQN
jgi:hypothetical protein